MGHIENYEILKNYLFTHTWVGINKEDIQNEIRYLNQKEFEIPIKTQHNIRYILFNKITHKITLQENWWMDFRNYNGVMQSVKVDTTEISKILDDIMKTLNKK